MDTPPAVDDLEEAFNLTPTREESGTYVMRGTKLSHDPTGEMTEEDWDQFEKDIADAFEQIP